MKKKATPANERLLQQKVNSDESLYLHVPNLSYPITLVVAFAKCQRKKKNLPTLPVLVPMFIKPF